MDRRVIRAWCLDDLGNSAFAALSPIVYGVYYAGTVVGGRQGDQWLGFMASASMLLVVLLAPFLGGVSDHAGVRKRMLGAFTLLGVGAALSWVFVDPGDVLLGFTLGVAATVGFEASIVFYNSYLPRIAPRSHHGRVSAWGFAVGYVGSLVALGIAAFLLASDVPLGWIWVALAGQWVLFAFPAFLVLPADTRGAMSLSTAARRGVRGTWKTLQEVWRTPPLRWFLLAYFLFMDGVETVVVFAGPYARGSLGFSREQALLLFGVVQVTALVGSLGTAKTTDIRGPRFTLAITLVWWVIVVVAAFLATTQTAFWIVAGLAGLGLGAVQSSARAFMARLVPEGREAEMFGFMALCGRTGSILGPLVFGWVAVAADSQRAAVLSVAPFFALGLLLLLKVRETHPTGRAPGTAHAP